MTTAEQQAVIAAAERWYRTRPAIRSESDKNLFDAVAALTAPNPEPASGWAYISDLRARDDLEWIECQNVMSGRWRPAHDAHWDGCVILVPWRLTEPVTVHPTEETPYA